MMATVLQRIPNTLTSEYARTVPRTDLMVPAQNKRWQLGRVTVKLDKQVASLAS